VYGSQKRYLLNGELMLVYEHLYPELFGFGREDRLGPPDGTIRLGKGNGTGFSNAKFGGSSRSSLP